MRGRYLGNMVSEKIGLTSESVALNTLNVPIAITPSSPKYKGALDPEIRHSSNRREPYNRNKHKAPSNDHVRRLL